MSADPQSSGTNPELDEHDVAVRVLDTAWEHRYQRFVAHHPHSLLYYSLGFRDFLVDLLGCEPRYAMAVSGGEVVGVLPLMTREGPYGRVLNSLPYYGSNGGILASGPDAMFALDQWYQAEISRPDVACATVITNPLEGDDASPRGHDLDDQRVSVITPLKGFGEGGDPILAMIDSSARRNVHKALRSGVEVAVDAAHLPSLERLHADNMDRIGGQAKTTAFFEAVRRHFRTGDDYDVYVALLEGQVVAALLVFYFGATVEYYVPAIAHASRSLQPLAAVLHRAMTDAGERGVRLWNWGGSWLTQESLIRFKRKWGGRQRTYSYRTRVMKQDLLSARPQELLAAYPHFYVAPFTALVPAPGNATT